MRHLRSTQLVCRCLVLVVAGSISTTAIAQNETQSEGPVREARSGQPDDLRAELERQLESAKARQARLEAAIKQLDEGTDPSEVQSQLRASEGDRGPRGAGRPGGREGRPDGFRRGGDGGGPPRDRQSRDLTPEDKEKIIAFIETQSPTFWERIKDNPESVDRFVGRFAPRYFAWVDAKERDPTGELAELTLAEFQAGYEVMRAIGGLYQAYGQDKPKQPEIDAAIEAIRAAIGAQFDTGLRLQRRELALLKARVETLETEVETKAANGTQTLANHLERIARQVKERSGNRRRGGRGDGERGDRKPGGDGERDHDPARRRGG